MRYEKFLCPGSSYSLNESRQFIYGKGDNKRVEEKLRKIFMKSLFFLLSILNKFYLVWYKSTHLVAV